jgi:predicted nucleic acid-binding protein
MTWLLDTDILSEVQRPRPDENVISFLHTTDEDRLFVSVISIAELHRGVALKPDGKAKRQLDV